MAPKPFSTPAKKPSVFDVYKVMKRQGNYRRKFKNTIDQMLSSAPRQRYPSNNFLKFREVGNNGDLHAEMESDEELTNYKFESDDTENEQEQSNERNKQQLTSEISHWALTTNATKNQVRQIALLVNDYLPFKIPIDPRTIMGTPKSIVVLNLDNDGGQYWHNPLRASLISILKTLNQLPGKLSLNINIDGLPLFKSSPNQFWPILCNIHELYRIEPIVIGIYCGNTAEIPKCKSGEVGCIGKTIENILRKYPKGNKEFGLPPVDKFTLNDLTLSESNSNGPVQLEFKLDTANVYGIEKANIDRVVGFTDDLEKSKFEVYAKIPYLIIKGKYDTHGRILLLPLSGTGDSEIKLKNVKIGLKVKVASEIRNGKRYAVLKKIKVQLEPELMQVRLNNIFNGNKDLSDSMNNVINENWRDIWTELRAEINKFVEKLLVGLLNDVLKELAYDDFYKKE